MRTWGRATETVYLEVHREAGWMDRGSSKHTAMLRVGSVALGPHAILPPCLQPEHETKWCVGMCCPQVANNSIALMGRAQILQSGLGLECVLGSEASAAHYSGVGCAQNSSFSALANIVWCVISLHPYSFPEMQKWLAWMHPIAGYSSMII